VTLPSAIACTLPLDGPFFDDGEMAEIVEGATMLPGQWFVGAVLDNREAGKPRVWVHPVRSSTLCQVSFGLRKGHRAVYVVVEDHAEGGCRSSEVPYANVYDVFSLLQEYTERLTQRRSESLQMAFGLSRRRRRSWLVRYDLGLVLAALLIGIWAIIVAARFAR